MAFFKRFFQKEEPEPDGFIQIDFEANFPHTFWVSEWTKNDEFPDGFRFKILSILHEPSQEITAVLVQEDNNGEKSELDRWSVTPEVFGDGSDLVEALREPFGATFQKVDFTQVRTAEEFTAKAQQLGWEVG